MLCRASHVAPPRVRGLKHHIRLRPQSDTISRTPRGVRGLKLHDTKSIIVQLQVAPLAGAWIETYTLSIMR